MALPLYRLLASAVSTVALWLGAPDIAFADDEPATTQAAAGGPVEAAAAAVAAPPAEAAAVPAGADEAAVGAAAAPAADGEAPASAGAVPAGADVPGADAPGAVTDAELDKRASGQQLVASLTAEELREMVAVARVKVLERLQAKMAQSADARMERIGDLIGWFSLAGLLLLAMPLVLLRKHPGQGRTLLAYSVLAAFTFLITVNLFGMVMLGFRVVQSGLGELTNPQLSIATGFFDTIDSNAEDYLVMGKELFAPTLAQLEADTDQPAVVLIANGAKLVKDADVFVTVAHMFKNIDFVFAALPIVLVLVTMGLFLLALWPTLLEIVRLPLTAAAGRAGAGRMVVRRTFRRVLGELLATLCTLGVLIVLTIGSSFILGHVVDPALDALLGYFQLGISYLQFVDGASSAAVFVMLFSVILFLVLNVVVVIASMTLYLGKAQKIFQRRFNDRVPLRAHRRFWGWGTVCIVVAQLIPLGYLLIAEFALDQLNDRLTDGVGDASQVPWAAVMLSGPLLLVLGLIAVFWAARGVKALAFLARYQVPAVSTGPTGARG